MQAEKMVVIFPTFEDVATIKATLPSVVDECRHTSSALIVHDSSTEHRGEIRSYISSLCDSYSKAFCIFSSPISMGSARNLCLNIALELYSPAYICMLEDDHGFKTGAIDALVSAMRVFYGERSPNGLRYGIFSGCLHCWRPMHKFCFTPEGHAYPDAESSVWALGGANSCFRCAPTSHWQNVLKGYDKDEYGISNWQTANLNGRNYHNGFTTLYVERGEISFCIDRYGRGVSRPLEVRPYDPLYTASDLRSRSNAK